MHYPALISLGVLIAWARAFPRPSPSNQLQPASLNVSADNDDYSFEQLAVQGMGYMTALFGTEYMIDHIAVFPQDMIQAHRAQDFNRFSVYMTAGPNQAVYYAINFTQGYVDRWAGPVVSHEHHEVVRLWRWNQRGLVTLQRAMDSLAAIGQHGPWKQVLLLFPARIPGVEEPPTEPFFVLYPLNDIELYFVGMRTGQVVYVALPPDEGKQTKTNYGIRREMFG